MLDYFHEGFSLAGAFKFVQLSLGQQLSDMIHAYQGLATMSFDIPNPDPLVHQRFEKILTDALESMFFKFVPVDATLPNTGDPGSDCSSVGSVGSSGGGVQAPYCVKAALTLNQQTVSNHRTIDINIDNVEYGTITSDAEIYLPAIDCGKLTPEVRDLLLKQADDSLRAACAPAGGSAPAGVRP
jgi:hypothetical protein